MNVTTAELMQQSQLQGSSVQAEQGFGWNGPICWRCNTPYLGHHECDVEAASCPDDKPGCRVNHWRHK